MLKLIARHDAELAVTYPRDGVTPRTQAHYNLTPGKQYQPEGPVEMRDGELWVTVADDNKFSRRLSILRFSLEP